MKKILFIAVLMCLSTYSISAQNTLFYENFSSNSLPAGWTDTNNVWSFSNGYATTNSSDMLLITPQISLQSALTQTAFLQYAIRNGSTAVSYKILVSSTGCNTTDFTVIDSLTVTGNGSWQTRSLYLTQYVGQSIYIAFQKTGGSVSLNVDTISVYEQNVFITDFPWVGNFNQNGWVNNGWTINSSGNYASISNNHGLLVTPLLQLPSTTSENHAVCLTYDVSVPYNYTADYQILILQPGSNNSEFTVIDNLQVNGNNYSYTVQQRSLSLINYEGEAIYIAFQRTGGTVTGLSLGNIWIGNPYLISEFPWSEDFSKVNVPAGWINQNDAWVWTSSENFGGNNNGSFLKSTNNQMLITPQLQLPNISSSQALYMTYHVNCQSSTNYQILIGTTIAGLTPLSNFSVSHSARFQSELLNLSNFEGQSIYIAFKNTSSYSSLYIDNYWVGVGNQKPTVITEFPWVETFEDTPQATNWINQGWRFNGMAMTSRYGMLITPQIHLPSSIPNQPMFLTYKAYTPDDRFLDTLKYQILISTSGTAPSDFTVQMTVSGENWAINSLDLSQYEEQAIYIAFQCTQHHYSTQLWIGDVWIGNSGTSLVIDSPWSENFNSSTTLPGWSSDGWSFNNGIVSTSADNQLLVTPRLLLPNGGWAHGIYFTYKVKTNSYSEYQILVSSTGSDISNFTSYGSYNVSNINNLYESRCVGFTYSYLAGKQIYIAFKKTDGSDLYLDDFWVGIAMPPQNVIAVPGDNRVELFWNEPPIIPLNTTIQGYRVSRDYFNSDLISNTSFQDNDVTNGTVYSYYLSVVYELTDQTSTNNTFSQSVGPINMEPGILYPPMNVTVFLEQYDVTLTWEIILGDSFSQFQVPPDSSTEQMDSHSRNDHSTRAYLYGYKVYRDNALIVPYTISQLTFTDSNVSPGTYTYGVSAVYSNGESPITELTDIVVDNILPPVNIMASVNGYDVTLTWEMGSFEREEQSLNPHDFTKRSNVLKRNEHEYRSLHGYNIYRENILLTDEPAYEMTYLDQNVTPGTYTYYVSAVYSNGESTLTELTDVVIDNIITPINLTASADNFNITLSWVLGDTLDDCISVATADALLYSRKQRKQNDTDLSQLFRNPLNTRSLLGYKVYRDSILLTDEPIYEMTFTDIDLAVGSYTYGVSAVYSNGESSQSNPVTIVLGNQTYPFTQYFDNNSLPDGWMNEEGWEFIYGYARTGNASLLVTPPLQIPSLENHTLFLTYRILSERAVCQILVSTTGTEQGDFTSVDISEVEGYTWQTRTLNLSGYFGQYVYVAFNRFGGSSDLLLDDIRVGIFESPLQFSAVAGNNTVLLSWQSPIDSYSLQGYKIYRNGIPITVVITATDFADNTVLNGNTYMYHVTTEYSAGISIPTETVTAILYNIQPPENLTLSLDNLAVSLVWEPPSSVDGLLSYLVFRRFSAYGDFSQISQLTDSDILSYTDHPDLTDGNTFYYYVTAVYPNGESGASNIVDTESLSDSNVVSLTVTKLSGNYPNPFNPSTAIAFDLALEGRVILEIYNNKGQLVKKLVDGVLGVGSHRAVWDGHDSRGRAVSSGIYFYRMVTNDFISVKKMMLLK